MPRLIRHRRAGGLPLPEMPCFDQKTPHLLRARAEGSLCPAEQVVTGVTVYHYAEDNNPPRA